jgi:hypothetical protein
MKVLVIRHEEEDGEAIIREVDIDDLKDFVGDYPEGVAIIEGQVLKSFGKKLDLPSIRRHLGLPGWKRTKRVI